ncbi:MAG TPA: hypothetical protein VHI32_01855 [Burkholderiales bacterium]|jgi:hypothetical protein|nr:hypothetical protein [Burkholderiales bacterium]
MIWKAFIAVLALAVGAQFFIEPQPHFPVERVFAWNALYGFLACAVLILLARALGVLLKRRDDYYDD